MIFVRCAAEASAWEAQTRVRRRRESFLTAGLGSADAASYRELRIMGMASGERVKMVFSRSSIAIWCVSRSESLEMEVRILCLSSTIARWEDREEEEDDDDDEGVLVDECCGVVVGFVVGFECFWELIVYGGGFSVGTS